MSFPVLLSPVSPLLSTRPTSCLQSLQLSLPDDGRWAASVMQLVFAVRLVSSWYIDCITNAMSAQCPTVITTQTPTEKIFCHRVPSYLFTVRERQRRKVYIQVSHSVKIFSQAGREPGDRRDSLPARTPTSKSVLPSTISHHWCPWPVKRLNWETGTGEVDAVAS